MNKPSPINRDEPTGSTRNHGEPDIAVFDESLPARQVVRSDAGDPVDHDLYRKPTSGAPGDVAPGPVVPGGLPSIADFWPDAAHDGDEPAPAQSYAESYPASYAETYPASYAEQKPFSPQESYSPDESYPAQEPYAATDAQSTEQYSALEPYTTGAPLLAAPVAQPYAHARGGRPTMPDRRDGPSSLNELLDPRDDTDAAIPVTAPPNSGPPTGAMPVVRPRRRFTARMALLTALLLLVGTGVTLAVLSSRSQLRSTGAFAGPDRGAQPGVQNGATPGAPAAADGQAGPNLVSAPLNDRKEAGFDLVNGTSELKLHTSDLGDELYRISTPQDSSVVPQATEAGDRVQLFLARSGKEGVNAVDIALNSKVRWDLRIAGGAQQSVIDMSDSTLNGIDLTGGATSIELTLPRPDGTLKVRMTGGVNQFVVHRADEVPVRVRVGSGAGQLVLDGETHNGIAPGKLFTPSKWDDGGDRIDLDAVAGMAKLTVDEG